MNDHLNCIELFAGCGGLSDGFEKSGGYKFLAFVEWEKYPCHTLINRLKNKWHYCNAEETVLRFDIQRTDELIKGYDDQEYGVHEGLDRLVNNRMVNLIIGGPPCQAYSIAGRVRDEHGMQYDYRNYLFESYLNVVKYFRPKVFVFENVEGILSAKPGGILITDRITNAFAKEDYFITDELRKYALLNASDFGVPQNRKRVIIIGVDKHQLKKTPKKALDDFYLNILPSFKVGKTFTVGEAIGDLPHLYPLIDEKRINGFRLSHEIVDSDYKDHIPRYHSPRDQAIFRELAEDKHNGKKKYPDTESLKEMYFNHTGNNSNFHKYHVLDLHKPSNTIPAHLFKDGLRHIHPDPLQARSITVREAARLQGFDDDFEFAGSMGEMYKMIGNAVPPPLGEKIALAVNIFIKKYF